MQAGVGKQVAAGEGEGLEGGDEGGAEVFRDRWRFLEHVVAAGIRVGHHGRFSAQILKIVEVGEVVVSDEKGEAVFRVGFGKRGDVAGGFGGRCGGLVLGVEVVAEEYDSLGAGGFLFQDSVHPSDVLMDVGDDEAVSLFGFHGLGLVIYRKRRV